MTTSIGPNSNLSITDKNGFRWTLGDPGAVAPNHKVLRNDIYQSKDGVMLQLDSKGLIWVLNSINEWYFDNEKVWISGKGPDLA